MNVLRIVPHAAVFATVAAGGLLKEDLRCRGTGPLSRRSIFCLSASIFPRVAVSSWRSMARRHSRLPITHTLLYNTRDLGRFVECRAGRMIAPKGCYREAVRSLRARVDHEFCLEMGGN